MLNIISSVTENNMVASKSFLSSRWGAFIIANSAVPVDGAGGAQTLDSNSDTNTTTPVVQLDGKSIMATALGQVRDLLGFRNPYNGDGSDEV